MTHIVVRRNNYSDVRKDTNYVFNSDGQVIHVLDMNIGEYHFSFDRIIGKYADVTEYIRVSGNEWFSRTYHMLHDQFGEPLVHKFLNFTKESGLRTKDFITYNSLMSE